MDNDGLFYNMSYISAGTTITTSLVQGGDTTGNLIFATGSSNTTALTINNSQNATFAGNVATAGTITATGNLIIGSSLVYANGSPFSSGAPALNINLQQNYGGF